jgi:toxin ParE1/3/4
MGHRRTPQADSDLDDIWYYIASNSGSFEVADRFIDSIVNRFFLLANHPQMGRVRDTDLRPGLRTFPMGRYLIVYRIQDEDVVILRVAWEPRRIGVARRLARLPARRTDRSSRYYLV